MKTHLRRRTVANLTSDAPHLLKLHSDFVESFCNDGDENVFHQPGQKEYHGAEVENRTPRWQTIYRSIHYEDPAFLRGCLIHSEYTGS